MVRSLICVHWTTANKSIEHPVPIESDVFNIQSYPLDLDDSVEDQIHLPTQSIDIVSIE